MSSGPCLGCGVKKNALGQLVIATGEASWGLTSTGCTDASAGTNFYCAQDGTIHGPAEKYVISDELDNQIFSNERQLLALSAADGVTRDLGLPAVLNVVNPSSCRSAQLVVEIGVVHGQWEKTGNGTSRSFIFPVLTTSGGVGAHVITGAHQLWAHSGNATNVLIDAQGSWTRAQVGGNDLVLPAGGSANLSIQGKINVSSSNGTTTYANVIFGVRYRLISN